MEDVEWCPRCNSAVIRDTDATQASCTNCFYSFCPRCREPFHGESPCLSAEQQLSKIESETLEIAKKLRISVQDVVAGNYNSGAMKSNCEKRKLLRIEYLSKMYLKLEAKHCPNCKIPVEKNGGCHVVLCTRCGIKICWLCFQEMKGGNHFKKCKESLKQTPNNTNRFNWLDLSEKPLGAEAVEMALDQRNTSVTIMTCARCHQRNLCNGTNNHIKCWSCKSNNCFQCKKVIQGIVSSHYTAGNQCKQHGDEIINL